MCMHACVYVCMHTYTAGGGRGVRGGGGERGSLCYLRAFHDVCLYTYINEYMHESPTECVHVCMCVLEYMHVCVHACMYVCLYA